MSSGYRIEHRVSRSEKTDPKWYKPVCDYIISQINTGILNDIKDKKDAVEGIINDSYYKKVLNPFNATDPKFTRYRADIRNFDIMRDIIRRYLGEFSKQPFDFQVKANDPDIITRFEDALYDAISKLAIQTYVARMKAIAEESKGKEELPPMPDFQQFYDEFKKDYIDDVAAQGQALLTAIIDWTESRIKYFKAFYDYIVLGQTFTYRDVRNGILHKEVIDPLDYHPISNGEPFIEDHNKGVKSFNVSINDLLSQFGTILDEKTFDKVRHLFDTYRSNSGGVSIPLAYFKSINDEKLYTSFMADPKNKSKIGDLVYRMTNKDDMINGYHVVFTTEVRVANLLYIDPVTGTLQQEIIEDDNFELDPAAGHVSVEWEWLNEVWEIYRFGSEYDNIYSEPRPIAYQRRDGNNPQKVKLPYNGLCEVIPGTGFTFSIVDAIIPYQLARNIFGFYRENIIAKNKDKIMIIPKSLMGDEGSAEEKIYRLEANSVFEYDDSEDDAGTKAQHIRILDASLSQFVSHISDLMDRMKSEAWESVDMNQQRYGDIRTSAGKATTEEAIVRSSMGSTIIFTVFESFLEKEYVADLEYSKAAYANGKRGSYTDMEGNTKFLDLDTDKHILANYGIHVVSSVAQSDKKRALKEIAFNASQNGEFGLAVRSVLSDNVASVEKAIKEYEKARKEYERQVATEKEQLMLQAEETRAKNDEANRTNTFEIAKMKEQAATEREIIKAESDMLQIQSQLSNEGGDDSALRTTIEERKLDLERRKIDNDMLKHKDTIKLKEKEIVSKEKIASANRNKAASKK
jgi:hypothetical protein